MANWLDTARSWLAILIPTNRFNGMLRAALPWIVGVILSSHFLPGVSSDLLTNALGGLVVVACAWWSWFTNSPDAVVEQAADHPEVHQIMVNPQEPNRFDHDKVVLNPNPPGQ